MAIFIDLISDVEESVKDDEGFNDSDGELVFCEATKQLMIDQPPPVLCIQLKRYSTLLFNNFLLFLFLKIYPAR